MKNRKNEKYKKLKQIAIDEELHRELKIQAAKEKKTIKEFVENLLREILGIFI
jgi:predicted HicB family RNase H-like nuclease